MGQYSADAIRHRAERGYDRLGSGVILDSAEGNIVNANVRACIAYAAGRGVSGKQFSGLYDYSQSKRIMMNGFVTTDHVDIWEETEHCHFSGDSNGVEYRLFYEGDPQPVTLAIKGSAFRGFDYGSSFYFTGRVQPNSVHLYDCETGLSFRFAF